MSAEQSTQLDPNQVETFFRPEDIVVRLREYCTNPDAVGFGSVRLQALVDHNLLMNLVNLRPYEGSKVAIEEAKWNIDRKRAEDPTGQYDWEQNALSNFETVLKKAYIQERERNEESHIQQRKKSNDQNLLRREIEDDAEYQTVYTFNELVDSAFDVARKRRDDAS